ncbi:serine hydrolase domain-containing protein [Streptomyces sp. RFCAC02]|uniref:serine hydrolase domain-containing protein n=1 Tax=Streptomyces sp. RFCAC02 TaxID=2499143 RepID=UPI001021F0DB|nr:serine hydrolase domain-containing protein [Streptomyces sp. RFCAC02]
MHVTRRRRRGLLALAGLSALLVTASAVPATAATAQPRDADPLQRAVDAVHDTGVVGVAAEVTSPDGSDSARAGTAALGTDRRMPPDGRFRIGSATKTFTATVVLQLVAEGRLSLDDTVERWLPGLVRADGVDGREITVRQLLQHTSGIPDVLPEADALLTADGYRSDRFRTFTPEELVGLALRQPLPETEWSYSNTNYILAAMIVHEVTGRSWEREVTDRIIRPLGLADTSAPGSFPFILGPHARAYTGFGTDAAIDVTLLNPSMAVGSGSIISTTHDLNRFFAALFDGRLLEPAELAEMTATVPAPDLGVDYGLGVAEIPLSCGGSYYGHVGELLGYRALAGATPDGSGTAVVYATGDGDRGTQAAMMALVDQELCATGS